MWIVETLDTAVDAEIKALPNDQRAKPKRVVIVRVFVKKTQKTPRKELKLALKRAEEIT